MIDIVVAKYKENINWLQNLKDTNIRHIVVYDKYNGSKIFTKKKSITNIHDKIIHKPLPNTGREIHTYLTYCVEYYDNLPEVVFFVQGNPFPHAFGDREILRWIKKIKHINFTHTDNYCMNHFFVGMPNGRMGDWYGKTNPSKYDMRQWFLKYIDNNKELFHHQAKIYFGANFGVSKDRILSRKQKEYQLLIDEEFTNVINPEAGHYMERSWYYLFNLHKI